ncbi:VOC family protein [Asanoa sp. NPDC049475]
MQITIDCADPASLAQFWATALHYDLAPPPSGFAGAVLGDGVALRPGTAAVRLRELARVVSQRRRSRGRAGRRARRA